MAEPASAILSFVLAGRATWKRIDKVLTTIKNAPVFIEDLKVEGGVLSASLAVMEERIRDRRNNLTGPEQDFYRAITPFTNRFKDSLEELESTLLTQRSGNKYWHCFKLQRKLDRQLKERLSRNIEIFHLSASLLRILSTSSASASGLVVPVDRLTRFLEGISDDNHKGLDESEQSDLNKWKEALNEVAFATYQQALSGPAVTDNPQSVPPNTSSSNGVSRRPSGVISPDELVYRFQYAIDLAERMYKKAPPAFAKRAYEEAMQHREMMQSIDTVAIEGSVESEILYVRIINACVPSDRSYESLQSELLEKLKDSLRPQSSDDANPDLCNEYEKVGVLCADLDDHKGAEEFLKSSLKTYLPDPHLLDTYSPNHDLNKYKIEQISMLVAKQYERSNDHVALSAFKKALIAKLKYDPTMEPNTLENTIEWCRQHNFQVGKKQGHLHIPEEYLANLTPLHRAAEDMHIQPEVIHQLMLMVPHATRDANGDTPLLVAVQHSNDTALLVLLPIAGSVNVRDAKGNTPLHRCDNERTMALLLEEIKKPIHRSPSAAPGFSLDIDSKDAYGTTALYQACEKGNVGMVRLLLQEGANVNIASAANEMPLMATCVVGKGKLSRERRMILKMLVNHGADTTHQDSHGKPAVRTRLKARNYKDKEIKAMLSPDPMARFNMNLEHGRNSVSTVTTLSTSSSPVELAADIPTRLYELAIVDSIPRLTPGSDRSIPAHDARSNLQLAELEGPMPGGTVV